MNQELYERLLHRDIPEIMAGRMDVAAYGVIENDSGDEKPFSQLLEDRPADLLASVIRAMAETLPAAAPEKAAPATGWFERISGGALERQLAHTLATRNMDEFVAQGEVAAKKLRTVVEEIDAALRTGAAQNRTRAVFVQAGLTYLEAHPEAGLHDDEGGLQRTTRHRFERRVHALKTRETSEALGLQQMRLSIGNSQALLDRYRETVDVVIPVWRNHCLSVRQSTHLSPEARADAAASHQLLVVKLNTLLSPEPTRTHH